LFGRSAGEWGMLESKRKEVTQGLRKDHTQKLHNLLSKPHIIELTKAGVRLAENVACMR
jgi:hypothetical protein